MVIENIPFFFFQNKVMLTVIKCSFLPVILIECTAFKVIPLMPGTDVNGDFIRKANGSNYILV